MVFRTAVYETRTGGHPDLSKVVLEVPPITYERQDYLLDYAKELVVMKPALDDITFLIYSFFAFYFIYQSVFTGNSS